MKNTTARRRNLEAWAIGLISSIISTIWSAETCLRFGRPRLVEVIKLDKFRLDEIKANFSTAGKWMTIACLAMQFGCTVGPNYSRPTASLPEAYTLEPTGDETVATHTKLGEGQAFVPERDLPPQWWELFQSQPLTELVEAAMKQNPNVIAAQAALSVAMEDMYAQVGYFYPWINVGFTPSRQKTSDSLSSNTSNNAYYYNLYTAQVSVTYTLDVFGSNKRQVESLFAQTKAEGFILEGTYLTLTSNVVNAAIQEASLRGQIAATKKIIALLTKFLDMFKQEYELGQISQVDVVTQEALLAAAEATLPPLNKQLAIQRDLIKTLAGRFPNDTETAQFDLDSFQLPIELPISLPSTLVENRPDVRAAEEQLHSASALVGVAIANRLPNITLGANYGWSATNLAKLFDPANVFWELMGTVLQPIFTGGTLEHREASAWAAYEQAAAQYRATVFNAFQNVADSLQAINADAEALQAAVKLERAAAKSLEFVRRQLEVGDVNILLLLTAEQTYQQAVLNQVQAQANRLADTVALFQSLGGGWWNKED